MEKNVEQCHPRVCSPVNTQNPCEKVIICINKLCRFEVVCSRMNIAHNNLSDSVFMGNYCISSVEIIKHML